MSYKIKEIYYTLQGEGYHTGRPAVFLRFTGCNLWSGREEDREDAICSFCDTDFVGTDGVNGGSYDPDELADKVSGLWPQENNHRYVVCTGGEPLLQLDDPLIEALHKRKFEIAIETNGTLKAPDQLDWICVSPKADAPLKQTSGDELKLIYPQVEVKPEDVIGLNFNHFYLQPKDGPEIKQHTRNTIEYCKNNPQWKLSVQSHKYLNIP